MTKTCSYCSTTVPGAAEICPHCRRDLTGIKRTLSMIGATVIGLGVIGASLSGGTSGGTRPVISISLADLERAFDKNEVGAMNEYGGDRDLIVDGVVQGVALGSSDNVGIRLDTLYTMPVWAHMSEDARLQAGKLRKGDPVRLRCSRLEEFMTKPVLHECAIA